MKYEEIINVLREELNEAALNVEFIHNGLEQVFLYLNGIELEEVKEPEELQAIYDKHNSFYKKAYIRTYKSRFLGSPLEQYVNIYMLESYNKAIAAVIEWYNMEEREIQNFTLTTGTWSPTSNRHEVEMFKQYATEAGRDNNAPKCNRYYIRLDDTCSKARERMKKQGTIIVIE